MAAHAFVDCGRDFGRCAARPVLVPAALLYLFLTVVAVLLVTSLPMPFNPMPSVRAALRNAYGEEVGQNAPE